MQRAIALALKAEGQTRPNPPVGAIVVRQGRMVGSGYHRYAGGDHAEIHALRAAGAKVGGATLYVTLEPCSTHGRTGPCTQALLDAGLCKVVVGCLDPNPAHRGRGLTRLRRAGVDVVRGVLEPEAKALIEPFSKWMRSGKPFLTLKLGMTADGRIADRRGNSKWITSSASRAEVQKLRKRADAILVGTTTALRDNPSLSYRGRRSQPLYRILVDASGRLPLSSTVLNDDHVEQTIIAVTGACTRRRQAAYLAKGADVWVIPGGARRVSLSRLMTRVAEKGLLHVLCEGGGEIAEDLLRRDLVDCMKLFMAPKILGGRASSPAIGGKGWLLAQAQGIRFTGCERIGPDLMITARR
jgi:diaminohydroxyphosphoribosylaminopyrimidine deaminase/5-amino-6-(5-phosphoribosylamino)uracil reductase